MIGTTPGNLNAKSPMFVTVSVPSLDAVRLQGAGNIAVTGIHSRALTVTLPGAGNIDVTGTTTKLHVTISGEGTAMLRGLVARDAKAALAGDGTIVLTATHSLTATALGPRHRHVRRQPAARHPEGHRVAAPSAPDSRGRQAGVCA